MSSVPCCDHILDSGSSCGSPAVKDQKYCFFHLRLHQRPTRRDDGSVYFILRDLTCVESIQVAISNVLHALNDGLIDSKKANSLYRGLGLALSALRFQASEKKHQRRPDVSRSDIPVRPRAHTIKPLPDDPKSQIASSHGPILSNSRVKALKRIIRQGPRHPLFHSSARRLEAHIVAKTALEAANPEAATTP